MFICLKPAPPETRGVGTLKADLYTRLSHPTQKQRETLTKPSTIYLLGYYLMSVELRSQTRYFCPDCPGHKEKLGIPTAKAIFQYLSGISSLKQYPYCQKVLPSQNTRMSGSKGDLRIVVWLEPFTYSEKFPLFLTKRPVSFNLIFENGKYL